MKTKSLITGMWIGLIKYPLQVAYSNPQIM